MISAIRNLLFWGPSIYFLAFLLTKITLSLNFLDPFLVQGWKMQLNDYTLILLLLIPLSLLGFVWSLKVTTNSIKFWIAILFVDLLILSWPIISSFIQKPDLYCTGCGEAQIFASLPLYIVGIPVMTFAYGKLFLAELQRRKYRK